MKYPFLFVALDNLLDDDPEILYKLSEVDGNFGFKINLDYLLFMGLDIIPYLKAFNRPLFFDLKMFNGKRTMKRLVYRLVDSQIDFFNFHMLADNQIEFINEMDLKNTKVLGVTVLSHMNESYCKFMFGKSLIDVIGILETKALSLGCHGVILPPFALGKIRHGNIIKVSPGIRPEWYQDSIHVNPSTPKYAVQNGADILVCGSPIMKSNDPILALKRVLEEMECSK